jgi:hypothetical protein
MISVSKFCCPVCWELFKAATPGIKISGCHPNVTPLALPETLSPEIITKMVAALRILLVSQLKPLLENRAPQFGHSRNESESGYSAASSNEDAAIFVGLYEDYQDGDQPPPGAELESSKVRFLRPWQPPYTSPLIIIHQVECSMIPFFL